MTTARNRLTQTQAERLEDSMNAAVCQKAILTRTPLEPSSSAPYRNHRHRRD